MKCCMLSPSISCVKQRFSMIFSLHTTFSGDVQFISRLVRLVKHFVPASVFDSMKVLGTATPLCVICQAELNISHLSLPVFLSSFPSPSSHPYPSMAISMASSASLHLTSSMRKMANRTKPRQHCMYPMTMPSPWQGNILNTSVQLAPLTHTVPMP